MRIGATFDPTGGAFYRGLYPLEAMARRGHEVVWPELHTGLPKLAELDRCDLIFVYRRHEPDLRKYLKRYAAKGIAIVWDNDDNFQAIPKDSPSYKKVGGLRGQQRFSETLMVARMAHAVIVTTAPLRDVYAKAGIPDVHVIENHLRHKTKRRTARHDGLIVGWVGGMEHIGDAKQLGLAGALQDLQAVHPDLQVECVGVNLGLKERYRHEAWMPFEDLPAHMARWDIGLAPLLDTPFNASRSNIKVKEYAASGIPWLASPHGPYAGLGEGQGGRLVDDGGWHEALDALIRDGRARKRLAKAGQKWAKGQTTDAVADRYEAIFNGAVELAQTPAGRALQPA